MKIRGDHIRTLTILGMFGGLLFSRALLSVSVVSFTLWVIFAEKGYLRWRSFVSDKVYWLPATLLLPVALSFFLSADIPRWASSLAVKWPLLFIPFAVSVADMNEASLRKVFRLFTMVMFVGMGWTIYQFVKSGAGSSIYLEGRVIDVPMDDDHVRFGWALALIWLFLLDEWWTRRKVYLLVMAALTACYIHWMGARTGVLYFYIVSLLFLVARLKRYWRTAMLGILLLPLLAWVVFPSFSNKVRYMVWDFQNYSRGNYVPGLSDLNRVNSAKAGLAIFSEHPFTGVGFGDVEDEKDRWYGQHLPEVRYEDRVAIPGSFLLYACGAGILALMLLVYTQSIPLLSLAQTANWFVPAAFFLLAIIQGLYEPFLEIQFGVFLYAFFGPVVWRLYQKRV